MDDKALTYAEFGGRFWPFRDVPSSSQHADIHIGWILETCTTGSQLHNFALSSDERRERTVGLSCFP